MHVIFDFWLLKLDSKSFTYLVTFKYLSTVYKMKYWRGIYFGGLADFSVSATIKFAINLATGIC